MPSIVFYFLELNRCSPSFASFQWYSDYILLRNGSPNRVSGDQLTHRRSHFHALQRQTFPIPLVEQDEMKAARGVSPQVLGVFEGVEMRYAPCVSPAQLGLELVPVFPSNGLGGLSFQDTQSFLSQVQ